MRRILALVLIPFLVQGTTACDDAEETGHPCGPGTHWDGSACMPDEDADTDTDADTDADSDVDSDTDADDTGPTDADGDGWTIAAGDCDDMDADVHPGAEEVVGDGVDQDCDGGEVCYADGDGDGYGTSTTLASTDLDCDDVGEASTSTDCDDGDPAIHPGAEEICGDGIDQDCNGSDLRCGGWGEIDLSLADAKLVGEEAGDQAGRSVAAGDIDGDGFEDVLVGAKYQDAGGKSAGAVYLVFGPVSGEVDLLGADAKLVGEGERDHAGTSVAAGDVNGDGIEDVLVGAHDQDAGGENAGAAYLVLGPVSGEMDLSEADAKLVGEAAGDYAGSSVAAGDVNGDGLDDVVIGAWGQDAAGDAAGAVYLVTGPMDGTLDLSEAEAKINGEYSRYCGHTGEAVATGDMNGDGVDDLLVGAPNMDAAGLQSGVVYLVNGPATGTMSLSEADAMLIGETGSYAGCSLATGDVDGDGTDDVLIAAEYEDTGGSSAGAAYLVLGPVSGILLLSYAADARFVGEEPDDQVSEVAMGDVDGDGFADTLVGAWTQDAGGDASGAAYLIFPPASGTLDLSLADAKFVGEEPGDYAGKSVVAGDTDGDGAADILIGAYSQDEGGSDSGAVYLVLGGGS